MVDHKISKEAKQVLQTGLKVLEHAMEIADVQAAASRITILRDTNGNVGIGQGETTEPSDLLSIGTGNAFTVDYVGNATASSTIRRPIMSVGKAPPSG